MRPSAREKSKFTILDEYNYCDWLFDLDNLCQREKARTPEEKFAWLVETIPRHYLNVIKNDDTDVSRIKVDGEVEAVEKSTDCYLWACLKLKSHIFDSGVEVSAVDLERKLEDAKERIKAVKIQNCNNDLNRYFVKFDDAVQYAKKLGVACSDEYLAFLFSEGVTAHKALEHRAALIDIDLKKYRDYHSLKAFYSSLIEKKGRESASTKNSHSGSGKAHVSKSKNVVCFRCNKKGHYAHRCPNKKSIVCEVCKKTGHNSNRCYQKDKGLEEKDNGQTAFHYNSSGLKDCGMNHMSAIMLKSRTEDSHDPKVYIDSCTTWSMTGRREFLKNYQITSGVVKGGNKDAENSVIGKGDMELNIVNDRGERSVVEILDVRHIEGYGDLTLIRPQRSFQDCGIVFDTNKHLIVGPDSRVIGSIAEDEYSLPFIEKCSLSSFDDIHSGISLISREIWHQRLGHVSEPYLVMMKKKDLVSGYNISDTPLRKKCVDCLIANNKRNHFERDEERMSRAYGEVLSVDIDVLPMRSVEGYKYRLDMICHASNYLHSVGLRKRSEAVKHLQFMVRHLKGSLKELRVDGAKEFLANSVKIVARKHGVKHLISDPYIHEQNSRCERVHQTVDSKVRPMLRNAGLPKTLWYKASKAAEYILNRTVTKALDLSKTPYEIKNGVKPSVSKLRVFGCAAYVHIPKENRSKLDDRGRKCIFVGYSENSNGYDFYDLETGEFFSAGSAVFVEDEFPAREMKEDLQDILLPENPESDYVDEIENELTDDDYDEVEHERRRKIYLYEDDCVEQSDDLDNILIDVSDNDPEIFVDESEDKSEIDIQHVDELGSVDNANSEPQLRRSARLASKENQNRTFGWFMKHSDGEKTLNYAQARKSAMWRDYKESLIDFLRDMDRLGSYQIVPKPINANIIGSRWVFAEKLNAEGKFVKAKARLTPLGYQQKKGFDYSETFAPVVMAPSSRFLHVVGLKWMRKVKSFDVENAFQTTKLGEEKILMEIPEGFELYDSGFDRKTQCLLLFNAINGLKQSGYEFNKKYNEVMSKLKFTRCNSDPCVFFKYEKNDLIVVSVHVDDGKFVGTSDAIEKRFVQQFNSVMKATGGTVCEEFLKVRIEQSGSRTLFDQTFKIKHYCERFNVSKPHKTFQMDIVEIKKDDRKFENIRLFQEGIGCLIYLSRTYRFDICTAVGQLATLSKCPTQSAWRALIRLFGYLLYTKDKKLVYEVPKNLRGRDKNFKIDIFVDASHKSPQEDLKSRAGYMLFVDGCLIDWYSKRLSLTAQSTEEAEVYAANEGAKTVLWIENLMKEIGFAFDLPILHEDCNSAIAWINSKKTGMASRHFSLRLSLLREASDDNLLKVEFVSTTDNVADLMTKVLDSSKRQKFCDVSGLLDVDSRGSVGEWNLPR